MKVEEDFNSMFVILDETNKGYLTPKEVWDFYQTVFYHDVDLDMVSSVVKKVCKDKNCLKKHFQDVLTLIEKWRIRDESAYWDFKNLDRTGHNVIPLSCALLLARSVKKEDFSLIGWNAWKNEQMNGEVEISWEDFKQYIYYEFEGDSQNTSISAIDSSYTSLRKGELHQALDKYQFFKAEYENDETVSTRLIKEKESYDDDVHYETKRLLNRWNIGGVEAVIYDDGIEWDDGPSQVSKNDVSVTELLSAMDEKYDVLRDRLLWEMVRKQLANNNASNKITHDKLKEEFLFVKSKEKNMRKTGTIENDIKSLYGSDVIHGRDLYTLMGETADAYHVRWKETQRRYASLKSEGKSAEQINKIFEQENLERMKNSSVTFGSILIELWKRQQQEKQHILGRLRSVADKSERLAVFTALYRQCERAKEGLNLNVDGLKAIEFEACAAGTGVAERKQVFDSKRYVEDDLRHEMMAAARLNLFKQQRKTEEDLMVGDRLKDVSQVKNLALVDSWMEVAKLLEKKHVAEREMLMHFLQNIGGFEKNVQKMKIEQQNERRKNLSDTYGAWKDEISQGMAKGAKASKRSYQLVLLHEGLALYKERLKREMQHRKVHEVSNMILGRLQTIQDVQFQEIQQILKSMSDSEIYKLRKAEYRAIRDEYFDNIASLIFPIEKLTEDEIKLNNIILRKYDALRKKLFSDYAKHYRIGEDFDKVVKSIQDEESSRREDRSYLAALCERLKVSYSANELLGPFYSHFSNAAIAHKSDEKLVSLDETNFYMHGEENFLSELHLRFRDECSAIRCELKETNDSAAVVQRKIEEQLWILATFNSEKSFLSSIITLGLVERTLLGQGKVSLRGDTQRYVRCSQERYPLPEPFNIHSANVYSNVNTEVSRTLRGLLVHHYDEWKKFRMLLQDETAEELREAASLMTSDERGKRLAEINSKRKMIDITNQDGKDDLFSLLEEAAALKHVSRKTLLKNLVGESGTSNEDVFISLLADLHQEQLKDNYYWYNDVSKKSSKDASECALLMTKRMESYENIFRILCKYEGDASNEALLQALEDKYDTLKDKLLMDALMRQMGEEEWRRLTERERQERLMRLKLEERRLRREGKMDELARLLGDAFANDIRMKQLLGESREEYEKRLREKLAARKRGENVSDDEDELEVQNGTHNPLLDLNLKLENEKAALLLMLNDQDSLLMSEKERQAALLRLKQARLRAAGEDRYDAAALVSGLVDRENATNERLKSDRERQRELARKRLEELKKKGHLPIVSEEHEKIIEDGDRATLEEAVLKKLAFLQNWERAWLTSLLDDVSDPFEVAMMMTSQQINDKLQNYHAKIPNDNIQLDKFRQILSDAALYRQALLARLISTPSEKSRNDIKVNVMADLQEMQDQKSRLLSELMTEMDKKQLITEQENLVYLITSGSSICIPKALFMISSNTTAEDEVLDALKGKYDAVIDALSAKVLPDKVGRSNWNNMSADERQNKISDLSSKVKELMNAEQYDEALDLLTEGLSEDQKKEVIEALFGDAKERKKIDLEERKRRMEERIKNGMSSEEAQRLFEEEGLLFEEQEKKRRRNVLEGLAMDFDAEKNALLKSLSEANDRLEAERRRQALLTKLRLQERQLRRENNLSSIAGLLAMSRDRDDALERERQRQMKLARGRIEDMKRRRNEDDDEKGIPELRLDSDDVVALADVVMREVEAKHAGERKALLQLMEQVVPGTELRATIENFSTDECKNRTRELRQLRRHWRNEDPQTLKETKDEHLDILKEAAALQLVPLCSQQSLSEEEGQICIMSFLQTEQKKETAYLLVGLLEKNPETIRKMAKVQRMARTDCWYDNVANALLGSSGKSENEEGDEEVVKALEEKYDTLKDKLLAEALMKKLGEREWAALSEKERQKRIMQIKQREKKLRRQGKYDELAKLFNQLAVTEQDIDRIFGEQRLTQEETLKKRKERIRQLRREKADQGLEIDDDDIAKQVEAEEKLEKQKRSNILLMLDQNLEAERAALLSDLRRKEDSVSEERRRQLAVARLRRQRRQMEADEKISAINYVLQTAKQDEDALEARRAENRQWHMTLAMERLAARKTAKQKKEAFNSLTNSDLIYKKLKTITNEMNEGSSTEQLLYEMEKKHYDEKEILSLLLLAAEYDDKEQEEVKDMDHEKLNEELEIFNTNRRKWREERMMRAIAENGDIPLKEEQRIRLSNYVAGQNKLLIRAIRHRIEVECRENLEDTDAASVRQKLAGEWMAGLEHTQENEIGTTTDLISDKDDEILSLLTQGQKRARREEWIDNIGKVVFGLALPGQEQHRPASSSSSLDQELQKAEEESKQKMQAIDKELLEEKKKIQRKKVQGEDIDTAAAFADLERQFADRKAALSSDLEHQRLQVRERLRERRQRKDESDYEAHAAVGMVLLAEQRLKARELQSKAAASKQKNLMQERLAARRERRRQAQEQNEKVVTSPTDTSVVSSPEKTTPTPFGPLRREKTVVNVNLSEKDREDILKELDQRTKNYQDKLVKGKEEQQKKIKEKIEAKRRQKERKAEELLTQFEREKTIMFENKSRTLERQKTMLVDRISKLKHEKTMTMKDNRKIKLQNFAKIMDDDDAGGLDKNEKMEKYAEELQKKLVQEGLNSDEKQGSENNQANAYEAASSQINDQSDLPSRPQTASRKVDRDDLDRILKQRMRDKKNRKERRSEIDSTTGYEVEAPNE